MGTKVLIISDSHGRTDLLQQVVVQAREEADVEYVIHCGDIGGDDDVLREEAEVPCYIVAGNTDTNSQLADELVVEIEGYKLFVTHGHKYRVNYSTDSLYYRGKELECQVVCFGHLHVPIEEQEDGLLVVNPGSISSPRQPGHKKTYIIMDLGEKITYQFFEMH